MLTNRVNEMKNEVKSAVNDARDYPEVNDIKQDVRNLRSDMSSLAARVRADGGAIASKVGHEVEVQAREKYAFFKKEGRKQLDRVEAKVHEKPMQSIGIAFAAGAILALLARR